MQQDSTDTERVGSRVGRLSSTLFNQHEAPLDDDEFDTEDDAPRGNSLPDDELVDRDSGPTNEQGLEAMNEKYQPGEDENQGPLEAWGRSEQVNPQIGVMQNPAMSPNAMQGGTEVTGEQ